MKITRQCFLNVLRDRCGYDGSGIVVGVSGGADSMCLLDLLVSTVGTDQVRALHVNHCIRGAEADRDMDHVLAFCREINVPCDSVRRDIPREAGERGISLEEAGRRARYMEMEALRRRVGFGFIACAHHAGDRAETIMMNLIRGTGVDGLRGMSFRSGNIIRPLLGFTKQDILEYVRSRGIEYVTDSTNSDNSFRRNSVRNRLFEFIGETYGTDPVEKLNSLGDLAAEDSDCLNGLAEDLYRRAAVEIEPGFSAVLDTRILMSAHRAVASRAVRLAIADVKGDIVDISRDHIDEILTIAGKTAKRVPLPHGYEAAASYGRLTVRKASPKGCVGAAVVRMSVALQNYDPKMAGAYVRANKARPPRKMYFDADAVEAVGGGIELRHRQPGDRIRLERGGTKKLSDWMTDEKIPLELRDSLWIVAAGGFALAAPEHRVFGGFSPGENSKKVYFLQID